MASRCICVADWKWRGARGPNLESPLAFWLINGKWQTHQIGGEAEFLKTDAGNVKDVRCRIDTKYFNLLE